MSIDEKLSRIEVMIKDKQIIGYYVLDELSAQQ